MSYTEIYTVGKDHCKKIGETRNAFRGAMYVWNHIAQQYFGLELFPSFDEELQRRIWNANNEHPLTDDEIIVLASTMDRVVVDYKDVDRLVSAFGAYAAKHPNSSFGEQAEIIKQADIQPGQKIAWCQTTVGEFLFAPVYEEDDETGEETECRFDDLSTAWDLFEQFDNLVKKIKR